MLERSLVRSLNELVPDSRTAFLDGGGRKSGEKHHVSRRRSIGSGDDVWRSVGLGLHTVKAHPNTEQLQSFPSSFADNQSANQSGLHTRANCLLNRRLTQPPAV